MTSKVGMISDYLPETETLIEVILNYARVIQEITKKN